MNILKKIEQSYNTLATKERDIAMYIINNPKVVQSITITQLAENTNTSIGSITRFCKRMECKNFSDFKLQMAIINANSSNKKNSDNNDNTLNEVNMFYREVINKNIESLDEKIILDISEKITTAKRVYIFGLGSSGLTAIELANRLLRMGIVVFTCTDSDSMTIASSLMDSKDLVIAISNSGNSRDIIHAVQSSKHNKATIVSFTSFSDSPLTKCSDLYILVYNSLFLNNENFINTQFSLMYLIDILSIFLLKNEGLSTTMKRTINAIHNK